MFFLTYWLMTLGCGGCGQDQVEAPTNDAAGTKVLFIGIDGLDPLLLRGLLQKEPDNFPNFQKMVREGFMVDLEVAHFPILSPILWTSMTTGYEAEQHGVEGWTMGGDTPVSQKSVLARRFWEAASQNGRTVLQLGSLMTSPVVELKGINIGDGFVRAHHRGDSEVLSPHVYPKERASEFNAMVPTMGWMMENPLVGYQVLATDPAVHPVGTDETFVRLFEKLWPELQPDIGVLYIKGADRIGHLADPDSETNLISSSGQVYNFSDRGPDWIHDYYLYVDEVLGRVLSQVDATKTTVVLASDHGFEINREEPEWASRHRDPGLLIGWGARVKEDVSYSRVGQLDLGVTMFSLVGVAPGADAKGRQLEELFDLSGAGAPLGSWILEEHLPLINGEEDASTDALMQELEALGYVDELGEERTDLQRSP